jgi:biofilm PGA synthesis protein PgaA
LRLEASRGWNDGVELGSREFTLAAALYSQPFRTHYRVFVSGYGARADFTEGDEIYRRYGTGLEFRRDGLETALEMTYNIDGGHAPGVRLAAVLEPGDHWSIPLSIEIFSRHTPLRALKNGIEADAADLGIVFRPDEKRRYALVGMVMDFDDGNFRRSAAATLSQRVVTRPRYRLDAIVELYASANDRLQAPYFNPRHDFSAVLTLDNQWRLYRRGGRSFIHSLALSGGNYWQKGYDDEVIAAVLYEHRWSFQDRLDLVYGISRSGLVFDGEREYSTLVFTRLAWRL